MKVVAVSDVTVGYGTPQLPLLTRSLAEHYRGSAQIVEPAQPEAPPRHELFPGIRVHRIGLSTHPHSELGRQEYVWRATGLVDDLDPDVLVICCTYSLPVLFRIKRRPNRVIYHATESIGFYGRFDCEMNRRIDGLVDLVIFPEENRGAIAVKQFGFHAPKKVIAYNVTRPLSAAPPLLRGQRNGRLLYAGTLDLERTLARYFLYEKMLRVPVDLFGPLTMNPAERKQFLGGLTGAGRYRGYVPAQELDELRRSYMYSIVMWNPSNENQLYAAPNKMFESIADGVPPICAPHPQCKLLVNRYGCGVLMPDWSFDGFYSGIQQAKRMLRNGGWDEMTANCTRAAREELNWERQFNKIRVHLE
jgi:hypothetical protein